MEINFINNYILDYIKNDKINNALLLKGPWGCGKSYYINNSLIDFLQQKGINCIVVSLYGMENLEDFSKAILINYFKKNTIKNVKNKNGKIEFIFLKVLLTNFLNSKGINIKFNKKELEEFRNSLNLKNKLIIVEDLERTNLELKDVLGYINNLTEYNNGKVLLIANENAINDNNYNDLKEKTIYDTISFNIQNDEVVKNIILNYKDDFLNHLNSSNSNLVNDISSIMQENTSNSNNFRILKYSLQKSIDIFKKIEYKKLNIDFLLDVFYGIVGYCFRNDRGNIKIWSNSEELNDYNLGSKHHPLYKFAFDYINYQNFKKEKILICNEIFINNRDNNKNKDEFNMAMNTIYDYYVSSGNDIKESLEIITKKINNNYDLDFSFYMQLVNYLVSIKYELNMIDEVDLCLESLYKNIKKSHKVLPKTKDPLYYSKGISFYTEDELNEYNEIKGKINLLFSENKKENEIDKIITIDEYCENITSKRSEYLDNKAFFNEIDIFEIFELLKKSNAADIHKIRNAIRYIYNFSNLKDYFVSDIGNLKKLLELIDKFIKSNEIKDCVVRLQLNYFKNDLINYINIITQ